MDIFQNLLFAIAFIAGGIAAVAGFGIGSLLTPFVATQVGMKVAVALVSVPHLIGTAVRWYMLREHVDRRVLCGFGLTSAAGGLVGALLHTEFDSQLLTAVFGVLLLGAGITGLFGLTDRLRLSGGAAWIAGALSGVFGGLVGNQGGIRSAALMGFHVPKHAFVATATTVALIVDAFRMPVYFVKQASDFSTNWQTIAIATVGVVAGTIVGNRYLARIPEQVFQRVVSAIILCLGIAMLLGSVGAVL